MYVCMVKVGFRTRACSLLCRLIAKPDKEKENLACAPGKLFALPHLSM